MLHTLCDDASQSLRHPAQFGKCTYLRLACKHHTLCFLAVGGMSQTLPFWALSKVLYKLQQLQPAFARHLTTWHSAAGGAWYICCTCSYDCYQSSFSASSAKVAGIAAALNGGVLGPWSCRRWNQCLAQTALHPPLQLQGLSNLSVCHFKILLQDLLKCTEALAGSYNFTEGKEAEALPTKEVEAMEALPKLKLYKQLRCI